MSQSDHYDPKRASHYQAHHRKNLRTRLTNRRELHCLYRALRAAGSPRRALDLPCGTGRFWPAFARAGVETLLAGDGSAAMLDVASANRISEHLPAELVECSAFNMTLPDQCVEFAACLRFYHHLARSEDRRALLEELRRVSSRWAAVSLWVDGNLAGNRRLRRPQPESSIGYGRRRCLRRAEVEREFGEGGFRIVRRYDVWPRISMWRLYLLEHDRH